MTPPKQRIMTPRAMLWEKYLMDPNRFDYRPVQALMESMGPHGRPPSSKAVKRSREMNYRKARREKLDSLSEQIAQGEGHEQA